MTLSRQAIADIESFAIDSDSNLGVSLFKQPIKKGEGHLIISLGASGGFMLREVKGLINRNCCSDHDRNNAPERVAYIAFGATSSELKMQLRGGTDQEVLSDEEIMIFSSPEPEIDKPLRKTHPWIFTWLDTNIDFSYGESATGGIRQAGRLKLFLDIDRVIDKLRSALTRLVTGTDVNRINVYVLAGISGGTESGSFLDMAYIVRQLVKDVKGAGSLKKFKFRISGYLLMPEVQLTVAAESDRPQILRNTGAALQELDQAMRRPEIGDYYECQYSNTMTIKTSEPPFDYTYLISAMPNDEDLYKSFRQCLRAVAEHMLFLVSGEADNRTLSITDRSYGCISSMQYSAKTGSTYKERSNCYFSLGYESCEITADKLEKYIFTHMFRNVSNLFGNEPTQDDAYNLFDSLGLSYEQIISDFLGAMSLPLNPANYTGSQLFGRDALDLSTYLPLRDWKREANRIIAEHMQGFRKKLESELRQSLRDPERGPIWTHHVIKSNTSACIDALDKLITDERDHVKHHREWLPNAEGYLLKINEMKKTCRPTAKARRRQEYIKLWNDYFRAEMEAYCCDLLLAYGYALSEADNNIAHGLYDYASNTVCSLNRRWLDPVEEFLAEMRCVVRKNKEPAHRIILPPRQIVDLDKTIDSILSRNGIKQEEVMYKFLIQLSDKIDELGWKMNVREFIEEFLQRQAQCVFDASMEELLGSSNDEQETLTERVWQEAILNMIRKAKPLFRGEQNLCCEGHIMTAANSTEIEKVVNKYISHGGGHDLRTVKWNLPNKISVGLTTAGLSLHDYSLYEECERQICLAPDARGLFLNQASESHPGAVNNMKDRLPSVIPSRKRTMENPAPGPIAEFERNLIAELREMRKGRYPFLQLERTADYQDYELLIALSVDLEQTEFYKMIRKENYEIHVGVVDSSKLTELIEKLKEIRYNTGLPETAGYPKKLVVCQNILSSATQEMKDRYHDVRPDLEEKIKEEVAWEVAEWYYVSAFSFYRKAKEEKAKYDEIGKKIEELERILDQEKAKSKYSAEMAKMLAAGIIKFERKYLRFTFELNGEGVELIKVDKALIDVKEMVLFKELERMRKGNTLEQEYYKQFEEDVKESFDDVVKNAYERAYDEKKTNGKYPEDATYVRIVIAMFKRLRKVREEAELKRNWIAKRNHGHAAFYTTYIDAINAELNQGTLFEFMNKLEILNGPGKLKPESEIFETIPPRGEKNPEPLTSWDCPQCGSKGMKYNFCTVCGCRKPVKVEAP